tara:strand:+ start:131 stop:628 length:498 start_codon:yes stop_codon:yes gene_type:complete
MKKILLITFLFILSNCSTPYQKNSFTGGYKDNQLSHNSFRVVAKGNAFTSLDKVQNIVLMRAAELTVNNNYDIFEVIKSSTRINSSIVSSPRETITTHTPGQAPTSTVYGGNISTIKKPTADIIIKMYKYSELNTTKDKLLKDRNYGTSLFIGEETKKYLSLSFK